MSMWLLDNKEWVKSRKEHWKFINPKLDMMINVERSQKKLLKEYYLTGNTDQELFQQIIGYPLFQLWFDPDQSEEHWNTIKNSSRAPHFENARNIFCQIIVGLSHKYAPDGSSFFDGLEEKLHNFFGLHRLDVIDYPDYSEKQFKHLAKKSLRTCRGLGNYLNLKDEPHPYDVTRLDAGMWRDAMVLAFEEDYVGLKRLVQSVDKVLAAPSGHHEYIVRLAEELNGYFDDPEFSDEAKKTIQKYRKKK